MQGRRTRVFIAVATAFLLAISSNTTALAAAGATATGTVEGTVKDAGTGTAIAGATISADGVTTQTGTDGHYTFTLPTGDHTVSAAAYGYATGSATVTVVDGGTTGQDFALVAAGSVTLSGKVTDASGHGWPLYARLDIAGRPGGPIFTNPATGQYSVQISSSATYAVTVTALLPGYQPVTELVTIGGTNLAHNFALPIDASCTAPGYRLDLSAPVFAESFDAASTPAGWTVVNNTATGSWAFDDPGGRGNLTGGTGNFAIADSDHAGTGTTTDTSLITPVLDFSAVPAPQLAFNSDFRDVGSEDFTDVDASLDGGKTWTNLYHQVDSRRGPTVETVPITSLGGKAAVQLRFHYFGTWDWWWQVDNVQVVNRTCVPVPGGLVTGFTTDKNTGAALNGVTVTHEETPSETAVSAATPNDPTIPDGFYWLFTASSGSQTFTADKRPYTPANKAVTVVADGTVQADFALTAGRLTVSTTSIEAFQTLGQTRTTTFTVTNTGSAPAKVDLLERTGDFTILRMAGAQAKTLKVPDGISKGWKPFKNKAGGPTVGASQVIDAAWTSLPNTPQPISDNAAVNLDGKAYSVGGGSGTGNEKKAFVYDPVAGAWATLPDLPTGRSKPSAAAVNGKVYVFGGWDGGGAPLASVDVFDPNANTWSTLAATNPAPRSAAGVAVAGGAVFLVGGCTDANCADSADTVRFDTQSGAFSTVAPYPHNVAWMSCGGISDKVYCAGGASATSFTDGFTYDPAANSWSPIAAMPVDLWGSQEAAASGLLVVAGGIANNSTVITNRTVAYDPASDSWQELPTATFPRARGAGACGVFKIGGWSGAFTPAPESERLDGLAQCDQTADVPWLTETPTSFALAAGKSTTVTVTLTATQAAGVDQPGDYTAQIGIRSNTPYSVAPVGVTMHVLPPASWGKFQGKVTGTSCAGVTAGVPAYLRISSVSTPDLAWSVRANGDGNYAIWLPKGNYELIAAKDGWAPQSKRTRLAAGFVVAVDFALVPFNPCK
jgi:N-acetylneuraminic acid mutarotase